MTENKFGGHFLSFVFPPISPSPNLLLIALAAPNPLSCSASRRGGRQGRDDGGKGGRGAGRLRRPLRPPLRFAGRRLRRQAEAAALPGRPRARLLPHLVPRLQRGGAGDLRAAGGAAGQGRGAPARLRRGQAHVARPGASVEGGPQVRAQGRANADPVGGWRRRHPPRGRRGAPQGQG